MSPFLAKATIDGVVRMPSTFSMTLGLPPSIVATQELVVPRSMPIAFAAMGPSSWRVRGAIGPCQHAVRRQCLDRRQMQGNLTYSSRPRSTSRANSLKLIFVALKTLARVAVDG